MNNVKYIFYTLDYATKVKSDFWYYEGSWALIKTGFITGPSVFQQGVRVGDIDISKFSSEDHLEYKIIRDDNLQTFLQEQTNE